MANFLDRIPHEFYELPTATPDWLRKLIAYHLETFGEIRKDLFFSEALLGYYDCMWEGMTAITGHVVYRLSDSLSEAERQTVTIYPSPEGSIVHKETFWDSLEDWRHSWEKQHPVIPELKTLLPEGTQLLIKAPQ